MSRVFADTSAIYALLHAATHEAALDLLLERRKSTLSLVDAASFVAMRRERIEEAFAFDRHFEEEGFSLTG